MIMMSLNESSGRLMVSGSDVQQLEKLMIFPIDILPRETLKMIDFILYFQVYVEI